MGQKVSPTGFRLGITEEWRSRWYADKDYAKNLANDLAIRKFLDKQLARAAVSKIEIERAGDKIKIIVTTARPGVVIGKKGAEIDSLRKKLEKVANGPVSIEVVEVKRPRARCCAHRAVRCRAARGTRCVPPCDAQGRPVRPQERRQGHPHPVLRPSRRCRDEPSRVVSRRSRAAAHAACQDRLRFRHGCYDDGLHRRAGVGVPRRSAPRPEGSPAGARGQLSPQPSPSQRS